jgi:hypothetical protein
MRSRSRMLAGTVKSISSATDWTPMVRSISVWSAVRGPLWRVAKLECCMVGQVFQWAKDTPSSPRDVVVSAA